MAPPRRHRDQRLILLRLVAALVVTRGCEGYTGSAVLRRSASRRSFLAKGITAASAIGVLQPPRTALAISVEAARDQWVAAGKKIAELDDGFDDVAKGGGDAVRVQLGTAGDNAASPLYQIDKALNKLLPEAEDPGEFGERLDDFIYRLRQADSMAYSANFAGGSGKPKPPAVYLQLSHDEVVAMRKLVQQLNAAL